jgi:hypothetical protein
MRPERLLCEKARHVAPVAPGHRSDGNFCLDRHAMFHLKADVKAPKIQDKLKLCGLPLVECGTYYNHTVNAYELSPLQCRVSQELKQGTF